MARRVVRAAITLGVIALGASVVVAAMGLEFPLSALNGATIGMPKVEVLDALVRARIDSVVPVIADPIVVRAANVEALPDVLNSPGVCVSDNAGLTLNVELHGEDVTILYASDRVPAELGKIDSRASLDSVLRNALLTKKGLAAGRCVPNARWISLFGALKPEDRDYLLQQPAWRYRSPGSASWVTMSFADGTLSRIGFRWEPFEGH